MLLWDADLTEVETEMVPGLTKFIHFISTDGATIWIDEKDHAETKSSRLRKE